MKRYLAYALIIGCVGHVMMSNAAPSLNHTSLALKQLGE